LGEQKVRIENGWKFLLLSLSVGLLIVISSSPSRAENINLKAENPVKIAQNSSCPGSTTVEQVRCARLNYEAADRRLNQAYQQVTASINRDQKTVLIAAQQAWIGFRDKSCEFETYANRRGSGYRVFLNQCLERVTRSRTAELESYLRER